MKFFIKTYGCQMNERDSEALAGMLVREGHTVAASEADADLLLFNTCSVRDQADRKAIGKIGYMRKLKKLNPQLLIGALGCMAQARGESLFAELPHLDFVLGTGELHRLPELLQDLSARRHQVALLSQDSEVLTEMSTHYLPKTQFSSYIAITRGCNRFCSYCIVPYVRGREISRTIPDVVNEAKQLVAQGTKEIMLLGQNVAAFGLNGNVNPPAQDVSVFADLLAELNQLEGLKRLRFTSPYVTYFTDKLIRTMRDCQTVCHNVHLPLQSGSDRILKAMNRQYTTDLYWSIAEKMREAMPDITFSTDVIVGFPGETDADFAATRDFMQKMDYDNAYIFKYSIRQGTKAATMPEQIEQSVKEERNQILLADLAERAQKHRNAALNTVQEILVEGVSKRNEARWSGKTATGWTVNFEPDRPVNPGDLVRCQIIRAGAVSLLGKLV